ncbi:unconventional myosin-VIIa-like isoform X1 [Petromyzon marinus]|uniref:unconventional myosin-VIIa-like isoform X1 n=2 Tax=Petromyzon marinus TaxID=7757 RepID=UPI003F710233
MLQKTIEPAQSHLKQSEMWSGKTNLVTNTLDSGGHMSSTMSENTMDKGSAVAHSLTKAVQTACAELNCPGENLSGKMNVLSIVEEHSSNFQSPANREESVTLRSKGRHMQMGQKDIYRCLEYDKCEDSSPCLMRPRIEENTPLTSSTNTHPSLSNGDITQKETHTHNVESIQLLFHNEIHSTGTMDAEHVVQHFEHVVQHFSGHFRKTLQGQDSLIVDNLSRNLELIPCHEGVSNYSGCDVNATQSIAGMVAEDTNFNTFTVKGIPIPLLPVHDTLDFEIKSTDSVKLITENRFCALNKQTSEKAQLRKINDPIEAMDDLSQLEQVNEEAILHVLHSRYKQDIIYTYIGPVLVAVNPYKSIPGLYGATPLGHYLHHRLGELPSHIYAMASELYRGLWSRARGQCVLISGESGAGKTESAKLLLGCLTAATRCCAALGRGEGGCGPGLPAARGQRVTAVQQALEECGLVLEAFGNARTAHNDNSSRVGKLVQLHFSRAGFIQGGVVLDYLLEKTRVVQQNPGDRNFHIFYALLAGASSQQMERLHFTDVGCHRYLNQQDCILSDKDMFNRVSSSLHALGLQEGQVDELWKLMAGIIHLGNMTFTNVGGAQLDPRNPELGRVAELLHVEPTLVVEVLTRRSIILRGEDIRTRLSVQQAEEYRDSLAMALYSRCFSWLLGHVNNQIHGPRDFHSIGILDIFGFENLKVNRFEQFNINYANEKLQGYFNKHMFSLEEQEYKREGIEWKEIPWMDNKDCLDLIEKKLGILALINEESLFPRGTDNTLLNKLHHHHSMNSCYIKPRMESRSFGIRHYAGEVLYDMQGFVEKNRDDCQEGVLNRLLRSRSGFVWELFGDKASGRGETLRPSQRKPTLLSQFKDSLSALMVMLSSVHPFFIRCIKPNRHKASTLALRQT